MLNILFFIESLSGGGAEKVLRNLVNAMDQSRFRVTVQTLYPEDASGLLASGIRYRSCYPSASGWNRARMRLEAAVGLTYPWHIRDNYDIEVAYLECGSTKILSGSTNKKALKLAWVHCDLARKTDDPDVFARKTARHYRKYDKVVCVSNTAQQSFRALYPCGPEAVTVYNTVDDENIRNLAEVCKPPCRKDVRNLVCAGRLSAEKGVDRLLRAHDCLLRDGIPHHLWLIGDGAERKTLEHYTRAHGLDGTVHFEGYQENPYPYLACADILVCPSRYEGFSTFVTEGLILGKPIVTTNCSGMHELLGNSEYGLITENDDEALYQGLKRMLTEPELRVHYAGKATERGRDFRQETLARETENFFVTEYTAKMEKLHGH